MSDALELDLKRKLRGVWDKAGNWSCPYEPGLGSSNGYPDIQILHPTLFTLAPIELKVAKQIKNGRIFPREVRPAQVVWHFQFNQANGRSMILIGDKTKSGWDCYAFKAGWLKDWRDGFPIEDCLFFFTEQDIIRGLTQIADWCAEDIKHALVRNHDEPQDGVRGSGSFEGFGRDLLSD